MQPFDVSLLACGSMAGMHAEAGGKPMSPETLLLDCMYWFAIAMAFLSFLAAVGEVLKALWRRVASVLPLLKYRNIAQRPPGQKHWTELPLPPGEPRPAGDEEWPIPGGEPGDDRRRRRL
jgi:hypothetical protein